MPYLHLPVQSGSDRILKAMNRKHDGAHYRAIVKRLRAARPDIALSTDFIVGFPGETEKDFEDTLALVRDVGFASAYSFKYSPRPGTPAAGMNGQIEEPAKTERLARLQALITEQQHAFNAGMVGRTLPILVTGAGRRPGQMHGRSPYQQGVHFADASARAGDIVAVRIDTASHSSLAGVAARHGGRVSNDTDLVRVIDIPDAGVAQAIFGPLHRHLAHIQEAFRDANAPRGTPAYRVTLDAQGDRLTVRARRRWRRRSRARATHHRLAHRLGAPKRPRSRRRSAGGDFVLRGPAREPRPDDIAARRRTYAAHAAPSPLCRSVAR